MALNILDLIVSIVQSTFFSYTMITCIDTEENRKLKMWGLTIILVAISYKVLPQVYGDVITVQIIGSHLLLLLCSIVFYKKEIEGVVTACSIVYLIISITPILLNNIIFIFMNDFGMSKKAYFTSMIFGYLLQLIISLICMMNIDYLKKVYKYIICQNLSRTIIILTFLSDFIIIFCDLSSSDKSKVLSNTLFSLFIGLLVLYFSYIKNRSRKINALNEALEIKNSELRKIKHDYGAQISYLYGICLLGRYDDLKHSLKKIINNNDTVLDAVQVEMNKSNKESILSLALNEAVDKGIHVVIDETCDFSLINIDEMELYRIFSNIVSNAIKAMEGKGTIIVKAYERIDNIIVKMGNNGPRIPEDYLNSIFKPGFTTKVNDDKDHGFGLSITKELIEKSNGSISVKSTNEFTEFKLTFKKSS